MNSVWLTEFREETMPTDYLTQINQYNIRHACPEPGRCALLVIDIAFFMEPVSMTSSNHKRLMNLLLPE
jgi:hypothetical protein